MTSLTETRRQLIALAVKTDIPALAGRYRMLVTALERLENSIGWKADNLRQSIAGLVVEIAQIKRDGVYVNSLAHLVRDPQ